MHSGPGSCARVIFSPMCSQPTFDHLLSAVPLMWEQVSVGIIRRVSLSDWKATSWFFFWKSDWLSLRQTFLNRAKDNSRPAFTHTWPTPDSQEALKHPLPCQTVGELASPWEPLFSSGSSAVHPEAFSSSRQTPDHLNLRRSAPPSPGPCRQQGEELSGHTNKLLKHLLTHTLQWPHALTLLLPLHG